MQVYGNFRGFPNCATIYSRFRAKVNTTEIKETVSAVLFAQINTPKEQNRIYSHRFTINGNTGRTIIKVIFLKSSESSKVTHMSTESEK